MNISADPDSRAGGYFEGFSEGVIDVGAAQIFTRTAGDGPAVLLVHGHPRTSGTWHRVTPLLLAAGCLAGELVLPRLDPVLLGLPAC